MSDEAGHMLECEARYLLKKPLMWRREYLAHPMVQARRQALEAEMMKQRNGRGRNEHA